MGTLVELVKDLRELMKLVRAHDLSLLLELRGGVVSQLEYLRNVVDTPHGLLISPCPRWDVLGHCPACHKPVTEDDDPVWTCPSNLSKENPHWKEPNSEITEEMQEKAGVYSFCGQDFGLYCREDLPLHGACYNGRVLTW